MVNFMDFYYTEPGTLAGRYMRKFWHPVYRAEDLPPGWAKPIKIMGEQFTLYRGEEGTPHVVDFRCPHRQSTLAVGWVEGDCIRCRFHGWKFDGSGQCVEQPAEKEAFTEKVRIRSCPTEEYLGLIFVYFGADDPLPLPRYPDFEQDGLWVETYVRPCNFLNNIENDPVHIPFTHKESEFFLRRPREIPTVAQEVFDVSGAGDSVIASFTLAIAAGGSRSVRRNTMPVSGAAGRSVIRIFCPVCMPTPWARMEFLRVRCPSI
jgi:5,5'-dehydrodivanillate O-demethylase